MGVVTTQYLAANAYTPFNVGSVTGGSVETRSAHMMIATAENDYRGDFGWT